MSHITCGASGPFGREGRELSPWAIGLKLRPTPEFFRPTPGGCVGPSACGPAGTPRALARLSVGATARWTPWAAPKAGKVGLGIPAGASSTPWARPA
eukprot:8399015-Alexandrium_andersonii.AAC.1